jgi:hypothetical protein
VTVECSASGLFALGFPGKLRVYASAEAHSSIEKAAMTFKQLELNAQIVRFPSGQETEFGGQAAYLMRIFGIDGDTVTEKGLENTPDAGAGTIDTSLVSRTSASAGRTVRSLSTCMSIFAGNNAGTDAASRTPWSRSAGRWGTGFAGLKEASTVSCARSPFACCVDSMDRSSSARHRLGIRRSLSGDTRPRGIDSATSPAGADRRMESSSRVKSGACSTVSATSRVGRSNSDGRRGSSD